VSQAADRYQQLSSTPPGHFLVKRLGLPESTPLRRYEPGQPLLDGPAVVGGAPEHRLLSTVERILKNTNSTALAPEAAANATTKVGALVFDASGITKSEDLSKLRDFFNPIITKLGASGRLIVLGTPPEHAADRRHHVAQRALEGFTRSAAKELRHGATGNLVYVAPGGEDDLESTLRFLLSSKSAYVSGQVIRINNGESSTPRDWEKPQAGRVAAVTGASRGIGAAIAETLARDGAHVIAIDIPQAGDALAKVANRIGGTTLHLDVTAADAPQALVEHLNERHGGNVDVVVHNAGITRDRTLARMKPERWDAVLDVNLSAQERLNDALLDGDLIGDGGRVITVSSIGGIAGNRGQSNYGASKAGVIGIVETLAPELAQRGATINAVAPGFIETQMTAAMPLFVREGGRRMNSLAQGGLPIDVAETIAWFASPASGGVNGNVVRVCGQSLIGA
jgi:3-oxoacyl-[acyl-carrier protein] reductase